MATEVTLLEFPCSFPIKVMGKAEPEFVTQVVEVIRRHAPDLKEAAVKTRASKGGNWLAVTVTIEAKGNSQLDAIFRALTDHEKVVMAL